MLPGPFLDGPRGKVQFAVSSGISFFLDGMKINSNKGNFGDLKETSLHSLFKVCF